MKKIITISKFKVENILIIVSGDVSQQVGRVAGIPLYSITLLQIKIQQQFEVGASDKFHQVVNISRCRKQFRLNINYQNYNLHLSLKVN